MNKSHQDEKEPSQIDENDKSHIENMMQAEEEALGSNHDQVSDKNSLEREESPLIEINPSRNDMDQV